MKTGKPNPILIAAIILLSSVATTSGIFSNEGSGHYQYTSIRGQEVTLYGKGLYKHMSAEVAPQGIAQDYVTLFIAIPLLIIGFVLNRRGSIKGKYLLSGVLGYFLVTYLFYTAMAMYNRLFLVYVALLSTSFYSFITSLLSFDSNRLYKSFKPFTFFRFAGGFLIFSSIAIAFLWLSIVVPPLLNGTIVPKEVEHYTTLIVQGFDLGILLPAAFLSGVLWLKKKPLGYLFAPIYFIFLSLLMTALTAKVIVMGMLGYNIIPVVFIIPTFNVITIACAVLILRNVVEVSSTIKQAAYEKEFFV